MDNENEKKQAFCRKVGERFTFEGKTLEVRLCGTWYSCGGCVFREGGRPGRCVNRDDDVFAETGECNGMVRDDKRYVYFAEVNDL